MDNNQTTNLGKVILGVAGVIGVIAVLDELFSNKNDTVNYKLKNKGRLVYHGICYEDRLDSRMNEHECSGKKFDEIIYDNPKPREHASRLERKRIRRDMPKYNHYHKFQLNYMAMTDIKKVHVATASIATKRNAGWIIG